MEALYVLLVFSLVLGAGFLGAFFWAHSRGQFEDSETPAMRILFDDYDRQAQPAGLIKKSDHSNKPVREAATSATPSPEKVNNRVADTRANIQGANYGS